MNADFLRRRSRRDGESFRIPDALVISAAEFVVSYLRSSASICGRKDDSFKLQLGVLEVEDQTAGELRDTEVIKHLSAFMVRDPVNALGIYDDFSVSDQVRDEFADVFTLVENLEPALFIKCNAPAFELHDKRILIKLFVEAMSQFVQHLERAADEGICLLLAGK